MVTHTDNRKNHWLLLIETTGGAERKNRCNQWDVGKLPGKIL